MDRGKYGQREHNPDAGVTNKVKRKAKNYQMVKHKIKANKKNKSFREKQVGISQLLECRQFPISFTSKGFMSDHPSNLAASVVAIFVALPLTAYHFYHYNILLSYA